MNRNGRDWGLIARRFPVTIVSAHAPHSDRPDKEAKAFWAALASLVRTVPASRALLLGIDANGDLHAADDEGLLIGDILSQADPSRNDDLLLEFCLVNGLEAPGTFSSVQTGQGWSWQHTSGRHKRLDHLLFRPGPWAHASASQAFDFDIINATRDHVALRTRSVLTCPRPRPPRPRERRATADELDEISQQVWQNLQPDFNSWTHSDGMMHRMHAVFNDAIRCLPAKPPPSARQPYLHAHTLAALTYLKDWRTQIRILQRGVRVTILRAVWDAWHRKPVDIHFSLYQQRLVIGAYWLHERVLQHKVHNRAKQDKLRHLQALTSRAVTEWHSTGQPMQAVNHLRWASRKAADRRSVFAAGGYDIEAALEEQFRAQEGGEHVSPAQLAAKCDKWVSSPAPPCLRALPTLTDLEQVCLRQKAGKAPGPDRIPNEVWRSQPARASRWLWQLYSQTALSGHEPTHFKGVTVRPL